MNRTPTSNPKPSVPDVVLVGISEMKFSRNPNATLVTYALGSCLAVAAYDHHQKIGGLIHCKLPFPHPSERDEALENPCVYIESGIPIFLESLFNMGARPSTTSIKVAGAASSLDQTNSFSIGHRNYQVLRKLLWKNNLLIESESTGGTIPRSLYLKIGTGDVMVLAEGNRVLI